MGHYKYLIVGGGMTAASAARGIRDVDAEGTIGMISREEDPPYNRPPLTKGMWKGKPLDAIWRKMDKFAVDAMLGRSVEAIYPEEKRVVDSAGESHTYEKLLLATGSSPRKLSFGGDDVIYYRTVGDYKRLLAHTEVGERFAVIGGGFIGSEIAASLASKGKKVTMVLPGKWIGERMFPADLAEFVTGYYKDKGVDVLAGEHAVGLEKRDGRSVLRTREANEVEADAVIAGIGVAPDTRLAEEAGLKVGDGIEVDEYLRTNNPDIYAAGDVASFWDTLLEERRRVEHEDNANKMGRHAGKVMAGQEEPWQYSPSYYSDLFDLGYEAVGEINYSPGNGGRLE